jgi:hypothetical protein
VFRYAIATGRAKHDISADLKGALAPKGTVSYATITDPRAVGKLLSAIDGFGGQRTAYAALRCQPARKVDQLPASNIDHGDRLVFG